MSMSARQGLCWVGSPLELPCSYRDRVGRGQMAEIAAGESVKKKKKKSGEKVTKRELCRLPNSNGWRRKMRLCLVVQ